jgi:hypothetical protein
MGLIASQFEYSICIAWSYYVVPLWKILYGEVNFVDSVGTKWGKWLSFKVLDGMKWNLLYSLVPKE